MNNAEITTMIKSLRSEIDDMRAEADRKEAALEAFADVYRVGGGEAPAVREGRIPPPPGVPARQRLERRGGSEGRRAHVRGVPDDPPDRGVPPVRARPFEDVPAVRAQGGRDNTARDSAARATRPGRGGRG